TAPTSWPTGSRRSPMRCSRRSTAGRPRAFEREPRGGGGAEGPQRGGGGGPRAPVRAGYAAPPRLPAGPAIYCFNHLSWADPFVLMAVLPFRPRLWFFGPKEEDMGLGGRNRLMFWTGTAIPYKPGKNDLLDATRRVGAVLGSGAVVAIAGEGRIHVRETELLPVSEGAAYFALRSGVPLVPI